MLRVHMLSGVPFDETLHLTHYSSLPVSFFLSPSLFFSPPPPPAALDPLL